MRMHIAAVAVYTFSVTGILRGQTVEPARCPPADSLYADRPIGPTRDLHVKGPFSRYATYVIDSVYVIANELQGSRSPSDTTVNTFDALAPDDIASIEALKPAAAARWNSCAGVFTILVLTKSKSWRPRAAALKDVYRDAFLVGAALDPATVSGADSASQSIVLRQFNTITPTNVMKAGFINPQPGVFTFDRADAFVAFGEKHKMFIVAHTLVWHNSTPEWFFKDSNGKPNSPDAQVERLRSYIQTVAGRYAGRVQAWDVVNEVVAEDGSYRPTTWVTSIGDGDSLVKSAFRFASRYAPGTELYYNEFNAWRPAKRDGILRLVRMLKKEGIRIDGVGMQGHWGLNYPKSEYIAAAIDSFAALGVKVMITELDVDVLPLTREGQVIGTSLSEPQFQLEEFKNYLDPYRSGLPDDVQRALAERYAELFRIFYAKRDKIDRVTFWGVHDGHSWKNGYPVPGRTNYPLLFGRDRRPKAAFDAVLSVPQKRLNQIAPTKS